jgi:hypothetical protein
VKKRNDRKVEEVEKVKEGSGRSRKEGRLAFILRLLSGPFFFNLFNFFDFFDFAVNFLFIITYGITYGIIAL